jgi:hypothetical protein
MKERDTVTDFIKDLAKTPLAILLLVADLVALAAIAGWVADDAAEATALIIFVIVLLVGQYLVYRSIWRRLFKYERAAPSLRFAEPRQAQMYHDSPVSSTRTPTYQVLEAWFLNRPATPTEDSIARQVTAKVTVSASGNSIVADYVAQWAISNAPNNVGFDDFTEALDVNPGHLHAKLLLALKYPSDPDSYAFTREGWRSHADRRMPQYRIPPGDYHLTIHLLGPNVDQSFAFRLNNPGSHKELDLSAATS